MIHFPPKYKPENCKIFVHNEIEIDAAPEVVWQNLTNAKNWNSYYKNAKNVKFLNNKTNHLQADTDFKWTTFDVRLKTQVQEFIPFERLAWEAIGFGVQAYHAWLLIQTEKGCKVITQETQHGFACRLGAFVFPNRMFNQHQLWLEGLKKVSENIDNIIF